MAEKAFIATQDLELITIALFYNWLAGYDVNSVWCNTRNLYGYATGAALK